MLRDRMQERFCLLVVMFKGLEGVPMNTIINVSVAQIGIYVSSNTLYSYTGNKRCPDHYFAIIIQQVKSNRMLFLIKGENRITRGKNLSEQSREPINSTHVWRLTWESHAGPYW